MMTHNDPLPSRPSSRRAAAGFTLAEVLLASILGAMLLTALTFSTMGFADVLTDLEAKAGVTKELDPVLRSVTRDIREAHWAEIVGSSRIKLADHTGALTEYYWDDQDKLLRVLRPNGDDGPVFDAAEAATFTVQWLDRHREGSPVNWDGTWYAASLPSSFDMAVEIPSGAELAMGFIAPVDDSQAIGAGSSGERFLDVGLGVMRMPVAWVPGSGAHNMTVTIYESWAPGSAKPLDTSLGSVTVAGSDLPAAVWDASESEWLEPDMVSIGLSTLSLTLEPGASYTAVVSAGGDAQLVVTAHPFMKTYAHDDVAIKPLSGAFVDQPLIVPLEMSGNSQMSSTSVIPVIELISISVTPLNRASQTRSAALLSQAVSSDPWLGVVPGEILVSTP